MILLFNKEVQKILIDANIFTMKDIDALCIRYTGYIVTMMMDDIQLYIEYKKLTEAENFMHKIVEEVAKKPRATMEDQIKIYTELFMMIKDYPELQTIIQKDMEDIDVDLDRELISSLRPQLQLKILEVMEAEIKDFPKYEEILKEKIASAEHEEVY